MHPIELPTRGVGARRRRLGPLRRQALAAFVVVAGLGVAAVASPVGPGWEPLPDLVEARQEVGGAAIGDVLYAVGGFGARGETLASAERLSAGSDAWELLPPMPIAVNHPAAAAVDGRLYVFGGFAGPALRHPVDAVQVYDPATGAWSLGPAMPTARGALAAAVVGDVVLVVGGARDGVSVADAAAFDPAAGDWTVLPDMPTPRDHLGAAAVDGRLHAIGGRTGRDLTLTVHEVFDPGDGAWSAAPDLPTGRSGHAVAVLGRCVYALGGEGNPDDPVGMFAQVERYVVATTAWEALPDMPLPRHGMAAVALGDRLLVAAGATVAGFGAVRAADAYRPPTCPA